MVKDEVLKYLENNKGKLISGGELSKTLNVSRTAIWKAINSLRSQGYVIESVSNEGYRLSSNNDILSENIIRSKLHTKILGNKFELLKTIDSTNSYAKIKGQNGEKEGYVVIAEEQTAGRGRRGRDFFSPSKTGIYMTILLKPNVKIEDINIITVATAIAVVKAIEANIGIKPSIKWVNDILFEDKKLCGILTEASIEAETAHVEYIIVGIGINISTMKEDFPEAVQAIATSVEDITHQYCDRNALIAEIINQLENYYLELIFNNNKKSIVDMYRKNLSMLGENIIVIQGNTSYLARAMDIDDNAQLIIEDEDGNTKVINSGEISIRRA